MLVPVMAIGRPTKPLLLTDEERDVLRKASRRRTNASQDVLRAKAILLLDSGHSNRDAAKTIGLCEHTVGAWRKRFMESRLAGLIDLPRSGRPRTISDEKVAEVIRLTLETKPENASHWSTRKMAARTGMSNERIARIWQTFGLQPHRVEASNFPPIPCSSTRWDTLLHATPIPIACPSKSRTPSSNTCSIPPHRLVRDYEVSIHTRKR